MIFREKEVVSTIIKHGGIEHLVRMITAQHALMQNEALMSLSILSAISLAESEQPLIVAEIGQALWEFFEQRDPPPDPALTSNALTLTSNLLKSKSGNYPRIEGEKENENLVSHVSRGYEKLLTFFFYPQTH